MILVQFLLAAVALSAALTVMAWAADRTEPTGPTCDIDGCDDPPTTLVRRVRDGDVYAVCSRCAEELTALYGWSWR